MFIVVAPCCHLLQSIVIQHPPVTNVGVGDGGLGDRGIPAGDDSSSGSGSRWKYRLMGSCDPKKHVSASPLAVDHQNYLFLKTVLLL